VPTRGTEDQPVPLRSVADGLQTTLLSPQLTFAANVPPPELLDATAAEIERFIG
jgi:hypothetical protein